MSLQPTLKIREDAISPRNMTRMANELFVSQKPIALATADNHVQPSSLSPIESSMVTKVVGWR